VPSPNNSLLSVDQITRECLRVLHQKLSFVGSINRAYDDSFAQEGAKIGSNLRIRLPNQYVIRTGRTMNAQDTQEQSVTLPVTNQAGVDLNFTSADRTMVLDDFSTRIITPAMSVVASYMEATALTNLSNEVYNLVDQDATAVSLLAFGLGRQKLQDNLAPDDGQRAALLSTTHEVKLVDALKGLFHQSTAIEQQYREGMMGRTQGFDFMSSTHVLDHLTGTAAKTTGYLTNAAVAQTGTSLVVDTGSTTFLVGDVITIAGVFRVHPETKISTGVLQQFVVTANSGASATTLSISPAIVATGGAQNVTNAAADNQAIVKVGAGASEYLNGSLVYHKDAFTLATADLVMPEGVDFAAREVYDGVSLRIVRAYDINNDTFPCRVDVLFGYKAIRPQLAARIHADG
jgi:hypothetical protein